MITTPCVPNLVWEASFPREGCQEKRCNCLKDHI